MNELNTRLLEYLPDPNTIKGGLGSVVEKLRDEAPALVEEIMRWTGCISLTRFVLLIVGIIICYKLSFKLWKKAVIAESEADDLGGLRYINLFFIVPIAAFFLRLWFELDWLKILVAPRLFLLEYIGDLIK